MKLCTLMIVCCFPWSVFAQSIWEKVADEGASFTLTVPTLIRYGVTGKYLEQRLQAGQYLCSNVLFTDPAPGLDKVCESGSINTPPVPKCYPYDALCDAGFSYTPKSLHYHEGLLGHYWYWWFQDASGKRYPAMALAPKNMLSLAADTLSNLQFQMLGLPATGRKAAADAKWSALMDNTCTLPVANAQADDFGKMCAEAWNHRATSYVAWIALMPPEPVWKVKPNGTTPDRPAYACTPSTAVPGGCIPGTTALKNIRATVGQLCKTDRPTAPSGTADLRAEFGPAFAPGVVTVCSKQ